MACVSRLVFVLFVFILTAAGPARAAEPPDTTIDFNRDVRPILSDKCFQCHGPDESIARPTCGSISRTVRRATWAATGRSCPASPTRANLSSESPADDEDLRMPPADSGEPLETEEIALLRRWIEEGAVWSQHWAYVPPRRHPVPQVKRR